MYPTPNIILHQCLGSASKEILNEDKPSESALRFKARNERHQRIAERAVCLLLSCCMCYLQFPVVSSRIIVYSFNIFQEKALAEKNMRDLLVQKEQAERNVSTSFLSLSHFHGGTHFLYIYFIYSYAETGRSFGCGCEKMGTRQNWKLARLAIYPTIRMF